MGPADLYIVSAAKRTRLETVTYHHFCSFVLSVTCLLFFTNPHSFTHSLIHNSFSGETHPPCSGDLSQFLFIRSFSNLSPLFYEPYAMFTHSLAHSLYHSVIHNSVTGGDPSQHGHTICKCTNPDHLHPCLILSVQKVRNLSEGCLKK